MPKFGHNPRCRDLSATAAVQSSISYLMHNLSRIVTLDPNRADRQHSTVSWTAPLSGVFAGIFRPEGAVTYQPRAERRGVSRGAPPWEEIICLRKAL